jgi:hypothetical protein
MNFCGAHGNAFGALTPDDVRGAIAAYGRRPGPGPSMFYNGFEGTDASAWQFVRHGGVDRNVGYSRTGENNGWVAAWEQWNAAFADISTGGAGHHCDVEIMTRMNGAPAAHRFVILETNRRDILQGGDTDYFDWPVSQQNIYQPVKLWFDATGDTQIFAAGFYGTARDGVHYMQIDDVTVNCQAKLTAINFDRRWQGGTSFLVSAEHLAPGPAQVRYENVPAPDGGFTERYGDPLGPDASHRLVFAPDMGLATAGVTCTAEQLAARIYAKIVDGSNTDSPWITFPARLLCFNG